MPTIKVASLTLGLSFVLAVSLGLGPKSSPSDPFIVEVIVFDASADPVLVEEIWSDRTTVIRAIGPNEMQGYKCGASVHCTNNEVHCRVLPHPAAGLECHYCTAGSATNNFCWPVATKVCTRDGGGSITCGNRMKATCVVPAGGGPAATSCSGGAPILVGTCTLWSCVP